MKPESIVLPRNSLAGLTKVRQRADRADDFDP